MERNTAWGDTPPGAQSASTPTERRAARTAPFRELWQGARPTDPISEGASAAAVMRRDKYYRRVLAIADAAAVSLAATGALVLVGGNGLTWFALAWLPLVVLVNKMVGLYDRDEYLLRKTTLDEAPDLFRVATLFALLTWIAQGALLRRGLGPGEGALLWILLFLLPVGTRALARRVVRIVTTPERCLVVGDIVSAERLRQKLTLSRSVKADVVGMVRLWDRRQANDGSRFPERRLAQIGPPVLGDLESLGLALIEQDVERVIFVPQNIDSSDVLDVLRVTKSLGVKVSVLPELLEVVGSAVEFDDVDGVPLMVPRRRSLTHSSQVMKRGLDVTIATAVLLLSAPLLAVIAIAIKLDSSGPVLFRQRRIGRHGRSFELAKFRTMVTEADDMKRELLPLNEAVGLFKISDDPRITRVGRLLRRAHLDELPQLLNVLSGHMSLVGPRPLVPDEDATIEGWYRKRLDLLPGMTGYWQIVGGPRIPLQEMVKIDHWYVANWSLWLDIKLLLRTIPWVLARRGL